MTRSVLQYEMFGASMGVLYLTDFTGVLWQSSNNACNAVSLFRVMCLLAVTWTKPTVPSNFDKRMDGNFVDVAGRLVEFNGWSSSFTALTDMWIYGLSLSRRHALICCQTIVRRHVSLATHHRRRRIALSALRAPVLSTASVAVRCCVSKPSDSTLCFAVCTSGKYSSGTTPCLACSSSHSWAPPGSSSIAACARMC